MSKSEEFAEHIADEEYRKAANRLHHLSMRYAAAFLEMATGKRQGMIPQGYPGLSEFRDIVDLVLYVRAEMNGHTRILVEAGLITAEKAKKIMTEEYEFLAQAKAKQFGIGISDMGLVFNKDSK